MKKLREWRGNHTRYNWYNNYYQEPEESETDDSSSEDEGYPYDHCKQAQKYFERGSWSAALTSITRYLNEGNENFGLAWELKGECLLKLGKPIEALGAFLEALGKVDHETHHAYDRIFNRLFEVFSAEASRALENQIYRSTFYPTAQRIFDYQFPIQNISIKEIAKSVIDSYTNHQNNSPQKVHFFKEMYTKNSTIYIHYVGGNHYEGSSSSLFRRG